MKQKKLVLGIIIVSIIGVVSYNYLYQNHRNISEEEADFILTTEELYLQYSSNLENASKKYLDKTIQLSGEITEIESDNFTLDEEVICYTDSTTIAAIKINRKIVVQGRVIGFDELLELIKLDQVTVIKNKE